MNVKKAMATHRGWQHNAECRDDEAAHADLFAEPEGVRESDAEREWREQAAKSLCGRCPVRGACLVAALEERDEYSIRGGLTATERRAMRRKANRDAAEVAKAA
ncbi:WhiB family transcriptional regulator [Yinghuangia sp. ASG 101]|uniref:WhiB family transcriptional regulator n=1 Tax=Yinghuangia sp. ASG 101 TaxID=2896848 RepID=UPI001E469D4C|nr:WhiB family transcriptional regulator [Yinghuangia sp. ASG 101]UGQ10029.1 WhiB family transcriptional regulator [Yinghuangia sp. ASG 101]